MGRECFGQLHTECDGVDVVAPEEVLECFLGDVAVWTDWVCPVLSSGFSFPRWCSELVVYELHEMVGCRCFVGTHGFSEPFLVNRVGLLMCPIVFLL